MKLRFFLTTLLVVFFLSWGVNILESNLKDFFYGQEISKNSERFLAQVSPGKVKTEPVKREGAGDLEVRADSAASVWWDGREKEKILFQKSGDRRLPIASLTKLMSALVVLDYFDLNQEISITKEAAEEKGSGAGLFKAGEIFRVVDLLYSMLIESNNVAAYALTGSIGEGTFVNLMNLEAKNIGLKNTDFVNSTGLDPDKIGDPINYSTAEDLVILVKYLLSKSLIWEILSTSEFNLYLPNDGIFHHTLKNTNELLEKEERTWSFRIVGGKTGWTPMAGGCLVLALNSPKKNGYLINIILGSENRFEEMENLVNWVYQSYRWQSY